MRRTAHPGGRLLPRNGRTRRPLDEDDTVGTMVQVAAGTMGEEAFIRWVSQQLEQP